MRGAVEGVANTMAQAWRMPWWMDARRLPLEAARRVSYATVHEASFPTLGRFANLVNPWSFRERLA